MDETELLPEAPAPAPASSARTPDPAQVAGPSADTDDKSTNGTPPGVIPETTEMLAEAPAPLLPASSARDPAPAQVVGTNFNSGDKSEPITDEKGVPITSVGYSFEKLFKGHGWFKGKVMEIRQGAMGGKDRRCKYEDGDMEDLSLQQLRKLYHAAQKNQGKGGASAGSVSGI